jgi:hypothetical protein
MTRGPLGGRTRSRPAPVDIAARSRWLLLVLAGASACGVKRAPPPPAPLSTPAPTRVSTLAPTSLTVDASRAPGDEASSPLDGPLLSAPFSAPIGAARVDHVDVVAGLIAAEGTVRAMGLGPGGVAWSADVLHGVAWAPDAELRLEAAAGGIAVVWRGLRDGKAGRSMVLVGPRGEPRGEPIDVGALSCATSDGIAWVGPHAPGPTRVRTRRWVDLQPRPRDIVDVPPERDPALVCGDHDVIVLGDGEDDLTASTFTPGDAEARPPVVVLHDADFADEQREHDAFTIGDDLAVVRIGASGTIAVRDIPRGGPPGTWRRLKRSLPADDEAVTVDGDVASTVIVATHDTDSACAVSSAGSAESVRAIVVDRKTGSESLVDLAPADCDRSRGPFWIAPSPSGLVVGWVERRAKLASKAAPIAGAAFRVLGVDGVRETRVDQDADAIADGGCDDRGCFVAILVREPGSDGMRPAPIRVVPYP